MGGLGIGNVYYVADTTSTTAYADLLAKFGGERYSDGSAILYPHTSTSTVVTTNGLENAVAACVSGRNDYVVVMPSTNTYYIDELLSLSKVGMHLVCPSNMAAECGSKNNARIQQIGAGLAIMSIDTSGVEVAGFYMKNIDTYAHITVPTTATVSAWGLNIHHNTFVSRSSTTSLPMLDCNGDGASYSEISYNWFQSQVTGGSFTNGIVDIEGSANLTNVMYNIISLGDNTATYGIRNKAANGLVAYNVILEQSGTFTSAITSIAGGSVVGNRAAVAAGRFSDISATTGVGYSDNMCGSALLAGNTTQLET
jgi:hypothetical protein